MQIKQMNEVVTIVKDLKQMKEKQEDGLTRRERYDIEYLKNKGIRSDIITHYLQVSQYLRLSLEKSRLTYKLEIIDEQLDIIGNTIMR